MTLGWADRKTYLMTKARFCGSPVAPMAVRRRMPVVPAHSFTAPMIQVVPALVGIIVTSVGTVLLLKSRATRHWRQVTGTGVEITIETSRGLAGSDINTVLVARRGNSIPAPRTTAFAHTNAQRIVNRAAKISRTTHSSCLQSGPIRRKCGCPAHGGESPASWI